MVITHNAALEAIADRIIRIREGRVDAVELQESPMDADLLEW